MTRKQSKCFYCERMIEAGDYQVVCSYFMKLRHSEKIWTKTMHFHAKNPNCWLDRAIRELELRPYVERRGRKPDALSDEDRTARLRILRRRSSAMSRLRAEMEGEVRLYKILHLTEMMEKLKVEIEKVGGVPLKWEQIKSKQEGRSFDGYR